MTNTADNRARDPRPEAGHSIVEILMAFSLVSVGLLGFFGAMISSKVLTRTTQEMNLANAEIMGVIESFKQACATDFTTALTTYHKPFVVGGTNNFSATCLKGIGNDIAISTVVVMDETLLSPPLDLNGDGDTNDTALTGADVDAAALRVKISWTGSAGPRVIEYTTIVARGGG